MWVQIKIEKVAKANSCINTGKMLTVYNGTFKNIQRFGGVRQWKEMRNLGLHLQNLRKPRELRCRPNKWKAEHRTKKTRLGWTRNLKKIFFPDNSLQSGVIRNVWHILTCYENSQ